MHCIAFMVLLQFDEERAEMDGEINVDTLEKFVDLYRLPLVVEFNPSWAPVVMDSHVRKHVLYFISKEDERFTERIEALRETAKKFKGHVKTRMFYFNVLNIIYFNVVQFNIMYLSAM